MKINKTQVLLLVAMILVAAIYRVFDRPMGFAPHIAIALFGGMYFKNRWVGMIAPIASLLISDALYQVLYFAGKSEIPGFYSGQFINYVLIASITLVGRIFKQKNWINYLTAGFAGPTVYFLLSNFEVWLAGGGFVFPKTFDGLIANYVVALPFYYNSILATFSFGTVLLVVYHLAKQAEKSYQEI